MHVHLYLERKFSLFRFIISLSQFLSQLSLSLPIFPLTSPPPAFLSLSLSHSLSPPSSYTLPFLLLIRLFSSFLSSLLRLPLLLPFSPLTPLSAFSSFHPPLSSLAPSLSHYPPSALLSPLTFLSLSPFQTPLPSLLHQSSPSPLSLFLLPHPSPLPLLPTLHLPL